MIRSFYNGKSAMIAQQEKLDSISNNISNIKTTGYKRVDVSFQDLVNETMVRKGIPTTEGVKEQINGTGVRTGNWYRDNSQGALLQTNSKTDLTIEGEGYFRLTTNAGKTAYTRNGSFTIDSKGNVADRQGNRLNYQVTEDGKNLFSKGFVLKEDNFLVRESGDIVVKDQGQSVVVGKINMYNAVGLDSMISIGDSLYSSKDGAQLYQVQNGKVMQGYLEGSNVDMSKEMIDMITTQRAFELGSRALKTSDEMWGLVNNLKGR